MSKLQNVEITDYFNENEEGAIYSGKIRITEGSIFLSYIVDDREITWEGHEHGDGHFLLKENNADNSKATLHRFSGSKILEGYFSIGEEKGMWRFEIQEDE